MLGKVVECLPVWRALALVAKASFERIDAFTCCE